MKRNQTTTDDSSKGKVSDTCEIFRDGCKTLMSVLVILTNDSGKRSLRGMLLAELFVLETHCDRLTSDDRFFSNLFRLLVTIQQSSLANEDKFDGIALVCLLI